MDTPLHTSPPHELSNDQRERMAHLPEALAALVNEGELDIDIAERLAPLSGAIAGHVIEKRLALSEAEQLYAELENQAFTIAMRRDTDQRSNLVFVDNGETYMGVPIDRSTLENKSDEEVRRLIRQSIEAVSPIDPAQASFDGDGKPADLLKLATVARQRFAIESHDYLRNKDDIAFDFGHVDQQGDWDAPNDPDRRVEQAISLESFEADLPDSAVRIIRHDRDHPKIGYDFWRVGSKIGDRAAIMVIRKRPYADVVFEFKVKKAIEVEGEEVIKEVVEEVCIEIFRKSWFLVSADPQDDPALYNNIMRADHGRSSRSANRAIASHVHETLKSDSESPEERSIPKRQQTQVLPCTMTYVAKVCNPNHIEPKVELKA